MLWLIDAGHGGIDSSGKYTTDPKIGKQFTFADGFTIYEGVTNRAISRFLEKKLESMGIEYTTIHDRVLDLSLPLRVEKINRIAASRKDCVLLSIHSNAGGGRGFEIFTSRGKTKSDDYAEIFANLIIEDFPEWPFRTDLSDGDLDKEADFVVLKQSRCPAVLFEFLFFDKRDQANLLIDPVFQQKLVNTLVKGILKIENLKPEKLKK
jgi:N-acetylmuramoyl-L-alanine amidase